MEEIFFEVDDGESITYVDVGGDDEAQIRAALEALQSEQTRRFANETGSPLTFTIVESIPEGALADPSLGYFSRFGTNAQADFLEDFFAYSDAESVSRGSGGGSRGGGRGGGGSGGAQGLTIDQIDLEALDREAQRLGIEAARLGVTEAEISALQSLNAEDRALIEEQFDLQREESQRAYIVQADPARGAANALAAGNFKSGVNGYAARVRSLVQETAIDQLENGRNRSLNSNSAAGVRLDAAAQQNALDGQELGLAQEEFNQGIAEINALLPVGQAIGGAAGFGENVLTSIGVPADDGIDLAGGI